MSALAALSDNLVHSATVVLALAMVAHAAEWAFLRERRTAPDAATSRSGAKRRAAESSGAALATETDARGGDTVVAVLERPDAGRSGEGPGPAHAGPADTGPAHAHAGGGDGAAGAQSLRTAMFHRIGLALTILGTILLGGGVVSRGVAAERVPWSNLYEFAITGSLVIAVTYLVTLRRLRIGFLALPLVGFLLVVLGIAITVLYLPVSGLIPALQSYWLVIHVSAAVTATGVLTLGAVASVLQIVKARQERRGGGGYVAQLPPAATIERTAYRLNAFAFPVWTFALIAGAIWAAAAWGRYWGWDPKETWMFITWVCYAAYLHARSTAGWRSRASWIALVAYAALLFNLIGVNFLISGFHSYTGK
ncbi:c-type cytochrome biogenesis protein CcsB [Actinopolymorpha sp. B17G11]|uniref:c-type cytochrome biogenesis protein CcsB n=1 Tax=Actinopolymorpha sp. B17G11 TaxID=3160861 RepID=UPI0032E4D17F